MSNAASALITVTVRHTPISFLRSGTVIRHELLEPAGAIDPRRLIERRVDFRHARQKQDGAESQQDPDTDDTDSWECKVEVAQPGSGDRAKPNTLEELVDQAREGQQPTPDDTSSDKRYDLGQEQNGPGNCS